MPSEELIIADSGPLIGLARIGQLVVLPKLAKRIVGTVALLGRAKREGLIPKLKPVLDSLVAHHIFIRQELIDTALKEAGE